MPIFLIGYMASGKSTVGRGISKMKTLPFVDLDNLIEIKLNMSICDIFTQKGECFFREKEHHILINSKFDNQSIIAVGGGTPCFFDNHNFMKKIGTTIYLKVTPNELCKRLELDDKRPLLFNNKSHLIDFISEQLLDRERYYQMSDYTIESDSISINQVHELVNEII